MWNWIFNIAEYAAGGLTWAYRQYLLRRHVARIVQLSPDLRDSKWFPVRYCSQEDYDESVKPSDWATVGLLGIRRWHAHFWRISHDAYTQVVSLELSMCHADYETRRGWLQAMFANGTAGVIRVTFRARKHYFVHTTFLGEKEVKGKPSRLLRELSKAQPFRIDT